MTKNNLRVTAAALCLAGVVSTSPAHAQGGDWDHQLDVYLWAASIQGATVGGADIDVGFSEIVENLDFTFMGGYQGRRGKWSVFGDVIHLNLGASDSADIPTAGPGGPQVKANVDMRGWVWGLGGGYNLLDDDRRLVDAVFGIRYLDLDFTLAGNVVGPGGGVPVGRIDRDGNVTDAVVGIRGRALINENWYIPYYVDVGGGGSDLTWQAIAGAGYRFGWGDLVFAYRHMEWDIGDRDIIDDLSFSGPGLLARWTF